MNYNDLLHNKIKKPQKSIICSTCGGKGHFQSIGTQQCNTCGGIRVNMRDQELPTPCIACKGSGKESYTRRTYCNRCNGTGKLNY